MCPFPPYPIPYPPPPRVKKKNPPESSACCFIWKQSCRCNGLRWCHIRVVLSPMTWVLVRRQIHQGDSAANSVCCQPFVQTSTPRTHPDGGRRKPTPEGCPVISTHGTSVPHPHIHTKIKFKIFFNEQNRSGPYDNRGRDWNNAAK